MRAYIFILISVFCQLAAISQTRNDRELSRMLDSLADTNEKSTSYRPISLTACHHPRQTGKLSVLKDTSRRVTRFVTDSSEMIVYASHFLGFTTGWENTKEAQTTYLKQDQLLSALFENGLLTSDLILKTLNQESIYVGNKGDTVDWTRHFESKTVKILNINATPLPDKYKRKKGYLSFEIWATPYAQEDGWGSFPMFHLLLQSDPKINTKDLKTFLKKAKVKCFKYTGDQL